MALVDIHNVAVGGGFVERDPDAPLSYGGPGGLNILPIQDGRLTHITADEWADSGVWVATASSNVSAIAYEEESQRLFVEFQGVSLYAYQGVPRYVAIDMFRASSKGKFVHQRLKHRFGFQHLR